MGKNVSVVTVVPTSLAQDLVKKRKITNFNTMQHINSHILDAVREFMTDNVGYADLPMACLNTKARTFKNGSSEIFHYLPSNSKDSVLFIMQMPEDMIVSVAYSDLLDASSEASDCEGDEDSIEIVKEDFKELLNLGQGDFDGDEEVIDFVPFLDYQKCKGYAKFDENFEAKDFNLPGIEKIVLAKLTAFIEKEVG